MKACFRRPSSSETYLVGLRGRIKVGSMGSGRVEHRVWKRLRSREVLGSGLGWSGLE